MPGCAVSYHRDNTPLPGFTYRTALIGLVLLNTLSVKLPGCEVLELLVWIRLGRSFRYVVRQLVMKNYVQERLVNLDVVAAVVDKAEFAETVHKEADPGAGCPDHFRESFLRNPGNRLLDFARFPELRH